MNDPITSAFSSVGQNLFNISTGTNPLFAPQVANLFGFNIPGIPLISARDHFLTQMESWFTSIPLTTQWIILIDRYPACVNTSILQGLERTDGAKKGFAIDQAKNILTSYPLQKITGCLFAQGISLPPETMAIDYVRIDNIRGFTPGVIARERENPSQLSINFLETNTSFVDFVIRPWVIASSHFGFVARNPSIAGESRKNVKANITVLQYTRSVQKVSMIPRKVWNFYNCAPISVDDVSLDYEKEALQTRTTKWCYTHYTVENNLYFPLTSIINRITSGSFPQVLTSLSDVKGFSPAGLF